MIFSSKAANHVVTFIICTIYSVLDSPLPNVYIYGKSTSMHSCLFIQESLEKMVQFIHSRDFHNTNIFTNTIYSKFLICGFMIWKINGLLNNISNSESIFKLSWKFMCVLCAYQIILRTDKNFCIPIFRNVNIKKL